MESLGSLALGFLLCKLFGVADLGSLFGSFFTASTPKGASSSSPSSLPKGAAEQPVKTVLTSTAVSWPGTAPAGLPPWPSGWRSASPVTSAMVARAWALMPVLPLGGHKIEQGPAGTWQAFYKQKLASGKTAVTVHVPRGAAPGQSVTT